MSEGPRSGLACQRESRLSSLSRRVLIEGARHDLGDFTICQHGLQARLGPPWSVLVQQPFAGAFLGLAPTTHAGYPGCGCWGLCADEAVAGGPQVLNAPRKGRAN